jgi:hypothetical protein
MGIMAGVPLRAVDNGCYSWSPYVPEIYIHWILIKILHTYIIDLGSYDLIFYYSNMVSYRKCSFLYQHQLGRYGKALLK